MEEFPKTDGFYRELLDDIAGIKDYREKLRAFTTSTMRFMADMGLKMVKVTYHTQIGPDKKLPISETRIGPPTLSSKACTEGARKEARSAGIFASRTWQG